MFTDKFSEFLSSLAKLVLLLAGFAVTGYVIYLGAFKAEPTMHDVIFVAALAYIEVVGLRLNSKK